MTIKRTEIGRSLTWKELDANFYQVDQLVTQSAEAVNSAITQASAAANSATQAAQSVAEAQQIKDSIDIEIGGVPTLLGRTLRSDGDTIPAFDLEEMKGKLLGFDVQGIPVPQVLPTQVTLDNLSGATTFGRSLVSAASAVVARSTLGIADYATRITTTENNIVGLNTTVTNNFNRTLRTPTGDVINQIPAVSARANKVLGFDASGQPVAITPSSGGSGSIGTLAGVADVTALRALEPTVDKQIVFLDQYDSNHPFAGGYFMHDASDTTTVDDAGYCFVTAGGKRWFRQTDFLLLQHYGLSGYDRTKTIYATDKIYAYMAACAARGQWVMDWTCPGYVAANGSVTNNLLVDRTITVPITGFRKIIIDESTALRANPAKKFTGDWVFTWGDPTLTDGDGRAITPIIEGYLAVICEDRSVKLNGIYLKPTWPNFGQIRAYNFRGMGIWLNAAWDGVIQRLSVERCGHAYDGFTAASYGLRISANPLTIGNRGPDTANCLHILSIQCEQAVDHGIYMKDCIRLLVSNIHAERATITKDTTMYNGANYINGPTHYFETGLSMFNQAIFDSEAQTNADGSFKVPLDPDGAPQLALSNTESGTVRQFRIQVGSGTTEFHDWTVTGSDANINVSFGLNTTYVNLTVRQMRIVAPTNYVRLVNPSITGRLTAERGVTVDGGVIGNPANLSDTGGELLLSFNANNLRFNDVTIFTLLNTSDVFGDIKFDHCTIRDDIAEVRYPKDHALGRIIGGNYQPTTFNDCHITRLIGTNTTYARIVGGYIEDMPIAAYAVVELRGGVKVKNLVMSTVATAQGVAVFDALIDNCINWNVPTRGFWPRGVMVNRAGDFGAGDTLTAVCINDTAVGPASWVPVVVAPAGVTKAGPLITTQPTAKTVTAPASVTLTVAARRAVSYQWQKSTDSGTTYTNVSGATSATFTIASTTTSDTGLYRAVVTGESGTSPVTSNAVQVTVS